MEAPDLRRAPSSANFSGDARAAPRRAGTPTRRRAPPLPTPAAVQQMRTSQSFKSTKSTKEMFKQVDTDGSGSVSKGEAMALLEKMGLEVDQAYIEDVWQLYDDDGSGSLDEAEFSRFQKAISDAQAQDGMYKMTSGGRLPGSKYGVGDIEINECATRK